MTPDYIGAEHEFHSKEFALGWAERFVPTPERIRLFELLFTQLNDKIPTDGKIVELGIGPGYLAEYLLSRMPHVTYCGIDYSQPMLEIAQKRLDSFSTQVTYTQADLVATPWEDIVSSPVHAVISTWTLHDLGSAANTDTVYDRAYRALNAGGFLLNGDFIKPAGAVQEFEGGRFHVTDHLKMLSGVGFKISLCLSFFEEELKNPTPAQNYACILAVK